MYQNITFQKYVESALYSKINSFLTDDIMMELIEMEKEKFQKDLSTYSVTDKENEFLEAKMLQGLDKASIENSKPFKAIKKSIKPENEFIMVTINDETIENSSKLKSLFEQNIKEQNKTFYYIAKAKYGDNPEHWFLTIQKSKDIYVIDPLSSIERADFFNAFMGNMSQFNYYRNSQKLQYSSGVCEMFAVKLAFYLARSEAFNRFNLQFQYFFINRKSETELSKEHQPNSVMFNQLHPVLVNALNEFNFGRFVEDKKREIETRKQSLIEQRTRLLENSVRMLHYSSTKTFGELFVEDINLSFNVLRELDERRAVIKSDGNLNKDVLIDATYKLLYKKSKEENEKQLELIKRLVNKITSAQYGFTDLYNEEYSDIKHQDFIKITSMINKILLEKSKSMNEELIQIGYVNLLNPYTSLKAGHMYFEALRLQQVLEDMRESEEENYRNSNPETFRLEYI